MINTIKNFACDIALLTI